MACGILPDQGSNPCVLQAGWFFISEPPAKPPCLVLNLRGTACSLHTMSKILTENWTFQSSRYFQVSIFCIQIYVLALEHEWRSWVFLSTLWNPKPSVSLPIYFFSFLLPLEAPDISVSGNACESLWFFISVVENMEGNLMSWPGCLYYVLVSIHSDSRAVLMPPVAFGGGVGLTDLNNQRRQSFTQDHRM